MASFFLLVFSFLACFYSLSASADVTVPSDSLTFVGNDYNGSEDYFDSFTSVGGSVPSGYILAAVLVEPHDFSNGHTRARYFYLPSGTDSFTFYVSANGRANVSKVPNSDNFYEVVNRFDPDFQQFHVSSSGGSVSSFQSPDANWIFYSFLDVIDQNGNETPVPSHIPFDLNVLLIDHNLYFNASTDNDVATLLDGVSFYVFPSSFPLTSTPTTVNSDISILEVSPYDAWYRDRKFSPIIAELSKVINENITHIPMILNASYTRSSALTFFNPDSYGLPYEYLGKWLLFTTGSELASDSRSYKYIDLKSVSRTGVWAQSSLCLVATWRHDGIYSVARWDFNIDSILNDTAVVPSGVHPFTPAPSTGTVSDFQGLADYLKNLADNNNSNLNTFVNNLIGGVGALPWANYIGTGFGSQLPQLSMYLDSLFQDLFSNLVNDFSSPSQEDIDALYAEIQAEKNDLKSKLAFVTDVKTEVYFIISTITADNNSVPPNFEVTLPSVLFGGGSSIKVNILSYELATPYIVGIIKDIITVFLSLSLVVYIWKTLPSTIGNMPRGDD